MSLMHHALVCRIDSVHDFIADFADDNVELYDVYISRFGIDDARSLVQKAYSRPVENAFQCLIVRTDFITLEAQNALLKIVEEPPLSTRFIFVLPIDFIVLPTLASRLSNCNNDSSRSGEEDGVFREFVSASYGERFAKIEKALKDKDLLWQQKIKRGLINYVKQEPSEQSRLFELEYTARLLLTRGASNKMLLDNLALVLGGCTK